MKLDIYQYSCPLTYFTDSYKNLKLTSEASLRDWSAAMGFESPSLVMDLLKKKRPLKLKYADFLAKGLSLNLNEQIYFKTLIQLQKAKDDDKKYFSEVLNTLRPLDATFNNEGGIYSHWLNVAIFTLSKISETINAKDVQVALKDTVSLETIKNSLKLLESHRLLKETSKGNYCRSFDDFLTTTDDVTLESSHPYYSQIISKAQEAVKMGVHEREFQCFSVGMKKENLIKAKEVMRKARQEILSFLDKEGDHVYQFNFNGFPLAEVQKEILN